MTTDLKEMILGALSDVGGRAYLAAQALLNPGAFMRLIGKVLPHQITGDGGGPVVIEDAGERLAYELARIRAARRGGRGDGEAEPRTTH